MLWIGVKCALCQLVNINLIGVSKSLNNEVSGYNLLKKIESLVLVECLSYINDYLRNRDDIAPFLTVNMVYIYNLEKLKTFSPYSQFNVFKRKPLKAK